MVFAYLCAIDGLSARVLCGSVSETGRTLFLSLSLVPAAGFPWGLAGGLLWACIKLFLSETASIVLWRLERLEKGDTDADELGRYGELL